MSFAVTLPKRDFLQRSGCHSVALDGGSGRVGRGAAIPGNSRARRRGCTAHSDLNRFAARRAEDSSPVGVNRKWHSFGEGVDTAVTLSRWSRSGVLDSMESGLGVEKLCERGFAGAIEIASCAGHAVRVLREELVGAQPMAEVVVAPGLALSDGLCPGRSAR